MRRRDFRELLRTLTPERNVPVAQLRYEYGFGFGDLYHPYTEALLCSSEREAARLLEDFFPTMQGYLDALPPWQALPIQAWRFGSARLMERLNNRVPSTHFGVEVDDLREKCVQRAQHLFSLRESIASRGYDRTVSQKMDGVRLPTGAVLLLGGQHRAAVLASLGWATIPLQFLGRKNTPRRLRVTSLPLVRSGLLPLDDAEAIVAAIQRGWSRERAREMNFPFAHG